MRTKLLSLILFLATLISVKAADFKVGELCYNIRNDGESVYVTYVGSTTPSSTNPAYSNLSDTITIPSTVTYKDHTYAVTAIGSHAFHNCDSLKCIIIPNSVTSIGQSAFYGCDSLISVTLPNSVITINSYAFAYCSYLRSIELPVNATVADWAFEYCTRLREISIPNSVYKIGCGAFDETAWFRNQPNGLVYAGRVAYKVKSPTSENTTLTMITLEDGTTGIAGGCFSQCRALKGCIIPNTVSFIGRNAFYGCTKFGSITIPNSVTSIEDNTFSGCDSLKSITIPSSVTSIGGSAFSNCDNLANVEIPESVTSIGGSAFQGTPWLTKQPNGLVYAGLVAYCYKGTMPSGTKLTLKEGTKGIAGSCFAGCETLEDITIPNSVTNIGEKAFFNCSSLKSIYLPNSVTSIGSAAFEYCRKLEKVTISKFVTSIGQYAFNDGRNLQQIIIKNENPREISTSSLFSTSYNRYNSCTLYVPKGSKDLYSTTNVWKNFKEIVEFTEGDVNIDEAVNAADVTSLYNTVLSGDNTFIDFGDVNGDGSINAGDVTAVYNIILGL